MNKSLDGSKSQFEGYPLMTPKDVTLTLSWSMRWEENHPFKP